MTHIHWHVRVRGDYINGYYACRCGSRIIRQHDPHRPMDWSWLARGTFAVEPDGPFGPGGGWSSFDS